MPLAGGKNPEWLSQWVDFKVLKVLHILPKLITKIAFTIKTRSRFEMVKRGKLPGRSFFNLKHGFLFPITEEHTNFFYTVELCYIATSNPPEIKEYETCIKGLFAMDEWTFSQSHTYNMETNVNLCNEKTILLTAGQSGLYCQNQEYFLYLYLKICLI